MKAAQLMGINKCFIAVILIANCINAQSQTLKRPQKEQLSLNEKPCHFGLDTSVNGLIWSRKTSLLKYQTRDNYIDETTGCIYLSNKPGTEFMVLHLENGGARNSYDIISVSKAVKQKKIIKTNDKHFISSNGVFIGMRTSDFLKLYNKKCFTLLKKGINLVYLIP